MEAARAGQHGGGRRGGGLSLVFLVFNEAETLGRVLDEAVAFCVRRWGEAGGGPGQAPRWEILVVDHGSTDASAAIARRFEADHDAVRLLQHARNRGMGRGMRTGIQAARCERFTILSADGQAPLVGVERMLDALDASGRTPGGPADVVVTTYTGVRKTPLRIALSAGLRGWMRVAAGIRFPLEGLYIFPTQVARELLADGLPSDTFFFSFELIDRGLARGLRLARTTMPYVEREAGASKVARGRRVLRVAREVARYGRRKRLAWVRTLGGRLG